MKIDLELLEKRNACIEGRKWFDKKYPAGCEIEELLESVKNLDCDWYFWSVGNLVTDAETLVKLAGDSYGVSAVWWRVTPTPQQRR